MIGLGMIVLWWEQKRYEKLICQPLTVPPVQSTANPSNNTIDKGSTTQALFWLFCFLLSGFLTAAGGWFVFDLYGTASLLVLFLLVNAPIGITRIRRPPDSLAAIIAHLEIHALISKGKIAPIKEEMQNCFKTRRLTKKEQRRLLLHLSDREDSIGKAAKNLLEQQN
ncbi:MAG: hypothetical protein DRO73_09770 [Candidatus Thorarchaeota archaeon]|nr:MAG: hypothetical protein DRO73_09770 [Candidatus Thorarchaeota archaeon]